ncbi:MAG TPA: FHA domain-containing protein, partial [Polyangiales bacterium]|nr:FHA domain-containing protein [Polyangiales bacterium]
MTNSGNAMLTLDIERGGKFSTFEASTGTMLIGSGSHCDVRLPPEEAASEQLLIELRGERVYVRALTQDGALRVDNARFEEGELASGAQLSLGELQLRVSVRTQQKRTTKTGD